MADLILDLRYAWRRLAAAPSFAIIAISTLAVGIGVTTAVYSLVYAMMFRPMNIAEIDRVVNINGGRSGPSMSLSWPDYQDLKATATAFEQTAAWSRIRMPISGDGPAEIAFGEAVEGTYFAMLGVPAAAGRVLGPADDDPAAQPVVVLSDRVWRTRYGGDPAIIGRVVKLAGRQFEVGGVAPAWFRGVDMPAVQPASLPVAHRSGH